MREKKFEKVLDIGSGSGIIGTSLADLADNIFFVDISEKALEVARKNFETHFPEKTATFLHSDLLEKCDHTRENTEILIVSNLPYIKDNDWKNMSEDTIYEPKIALFGGEKTGFELYEKLFLEISEKKIAGMVLIEFGFDQRNIAENFLKKFPSWEVDFFADYAGIERFAEIKIMQESAS